MEQEEAEFTYLLTKIKKNHFSLHFVKVNQVKHSPSHIYLEKIHFCTSFKWFAFIAHFMLSSRPFHNTTAQTEIPISINSFTEVVTAFITALVLMHPIITRKATALVSSFLSSK